MTTVPTPTESGAATDLAASGQRPIVVGIDGSPSSTAALRWAAAEARGHGRPLMVIDVVSTPAYFGYPLTAVPDMDDALMQGARAALDEALAEVFGDSHPADVRRIVRHGAPAPVLIEATKDASLLVVGARGHGRHRLGSVSDRCVHHAACPVVIVRD